MGYENNHFSFLLRYDYFDKEEIITLESVNYGIKYSMALLKLYSYSELYKRGYRYIKFNPLFGYEFKVRKIVKYDLDINDFINQLIKLDIFSIKKDLIILKNISTHSERNRSGKEYSDWRIAVFKRDNYTCQLCGKYGGKLEAHHKKKWSEFKEFRYVVSNGITLCKDCHKRIHFGT